MTWFFRQHRRLICSMFLLQLVVALGCRAEPEIPADLVLLDGKVVTVDDNVPEGQAIAMKGDTILAVGSNREIRAYIGAETEVIDLDGNLAIPGFIDSHVHFTGIGQARMQLNLMGVANWEEIVSMVEAVVGDAATGELITGRGWHQEKWDHTPDDNVDGLPTHHSLSAVSPNNPVVLRHASGHASFANAKAMEMSNITARTPDPAGGEIVRDANGEPIGAFRETAQRLLGGASEGAEQPDPRRIIELANQEVISNGLTTVHDAGSPFETIDLIKEMVAAGEIDVRLWVMIRDSNERLALNLPDYWMLGYGNNHLTVRAVKRTLDGALGPHGAWLLEPYEDLPTSSGLNTGTVASVTESARLAALNGYQLAIHAIGDRANRESLNIIEQAYNLYPNRTDWRWRIEHSQHLHLDDIPRFAQIGVIPSMQGIHCTSDALYVLERLGERRAEEGAYVWQKLMATGAIIPNGTDAPVEDVSPIASFYSTVSRRLADGSVFYPDQRMSREEALRSYTINGAYTGFEEDIKGSLTPGKLADVTVLSKDIMTVSEEEIPSTEVVYTIIGGKVVYSRESAQH
jgi:predicted amidohydrolase YtcJ